MKVESVEPKTEKHGQCALGTGAQSLRACLNYGATHTLVKQEIERPNKLNIFILSQSPP